MYNDIERADNYIDLSATRGHLEDIFHGVLYGYYYEYQQCDDKPFLKFSLYFVTPFDNIDWKVHGDYNGFCKQDLDGFGSAILKTKSIPTKNMQVVPLQYDDYYGGDEEGNSIPKTKPTVKELITTNIYKDEQSFFDKLFHKKSPYQIKEVLDHNMFYKVTFEVPFDVIADYITVDKILIKDDTEKTKSMYSTTHLNYVDGLMKSLTRARSILNEMDSLITKIKADPEKFKKDNTGSDWAEECRTKGGLNLEAAEVLFKKCKADFEQMEGVLWGATTWDITKEPKDTPNTKCSHDLCIRDKEPGSQYCKYCIRLPTKECNRCKKE
jgi:hypothetical protein